MRLFPRRRRGRHELGAAVRDIPSAVPVVVAHPPAPHVEAIVEEALAAAVPGVPVQDLPRVELGFRDGSTAELPSDSPQTWAFVAIAGTLARRD